MYVDWANVYIKEDDSLHPLNLKYEEMMKFENYD